MCMIITVYMTIDYVLICDWFEAAFQTFFLADLHHVPFIIMGSLVSLFSHMFTVLFKFI